MRLLNVILVALLVVGCSPRGESKSLSEVIEDGKARYMAVKGVNLNAEVQAKLGAVVGKLEEILVAAQEGGINGSDLGEVEELLSQLVDHAGMTARAGMNQLAKQYRELSGSAESANSGAVGLLVGRTYSAIGAELETTKFGL